MPCHVQTRHVQGLLFEADRTLAEQHRATQCAGRLVNTTLCPFPLAGLAACGLTDTYSVITPCGPSHFVPEYPATFPPPNLYYPSVCPAAPAYPPAATDTPLT